MRKIFTWFATISLIVFVFNNLLATPVDSTRAKESALSFFSSLTKTSSNQLMEEGVSIAYRAYMEKTMVGQTDVVCFYVVNVGRKGFVMLSGDDRIKPVLGYSYESSFRTKDIPENLQGWLDGKRKEIAYALAMADFVAVPEITEQWNHLSEIGAALSVVVQPLLQTTWDQNAYYNQYCPADPNGPNGHAYAGCVATAVAQIIRYWEWPGSGFNNHSYSCNYGTLSVDYSSATYNYNNMPNSIDNSSTPIQKDAVASLIYHCGVSVNMDYGPDFSGAASYDVMTALVRYFAYPSGMSFQSKSNYTSVEWNNLLRNELNNNRPVLYSGQRTGGHAFVCDGYDNNGSYHFNWGWSGYFNGYYALNALIPSSGYNSPGYNFSDNQEAILGISAAGAFLRCSQNNLNMSAPIGSSSAVKDVDVRGHSLNGNITVTAGSGFTVGTDGNTFSNSATIPAQGGRLYLRYTPTLSSPGSQSTNVVLASGAVRDTIFCTGTAVEEVCLPPRNLTGTHTGSQVHLSWSEPVSYGSGSEAVTLSWDSTVAGGNFGFGENMTVCMLQRFDVNDVAPYHQYLLKSISFIPAFQGTSFRLVVYKGGNYFNGCHPGTQIVNQEVPAASLVRDTWNTVPLNSPVLVDASEELWFGFMVYTTGNYGYVIPVSTGSYVPDKGSVCGVCGGYNDGTGYFSWNPVSLEFNFPIKGHLEQLSADGLHYDVYRQSSLLGSTSNTSFSDGSPLSNSCEYTVAAVWGGGCSESASVTVEASTTPAISYGDTTATVCGSFDWYEHTNINVSGEYTHTFVGGSASGGDSVVTLHLTVLPIPQIELTYPETICPGAESVDFTMQVTSNQTEAPYTVQQSSDFDADATNTLNSPYPVLSNYYTKPFTKITDFECGNSYHLYYTVTDANGCVARDTATFIAIDITAPAFVATTGNSIYQRLAPKRGTNCTFNSLSKGEFVSAFLRTAQVYDDCMAYDSAYLYDHCEFYWEESSQFGHVKAYNTHDIFRNLVGNQLTVEVIVEDNCGNQADTLAFWFEPDTLIVPNVTVDPEICFGDTAFLSFDSTLVDFGYHFDVAHPLTFAWSCANADINFNDANSVNTFVVPGTGDETYHVNLTVSDAYGCAATTDNAAIQVKAAPNIAIIPHENNVCQPPYTYVPNVGVVWEGSYSPNVGIIWLAARDASNPSQTIPNLTYQWTNSYTSNILSVEDTAELWIIPDSCSFVYDAQVFVTDLYGCSAEASIFIPVQDRAPNYIGPEHFDTAYVESNCVMRVTDFTHYVVDNLYNPCGNWPPKSIWQVPAVGTEMTANTDVTVYIVSQCGEDTLIITDKFKNIPEANSFSVTASVEPSEGCSPVTFAFNATTANATGAVTYKWTKGTDIMTISNAQSFSRTEVSEPGQMESLYTFQVEATDAMNCKATSSVQVSVYDALFEPDYVVFPNQNCGASYNGVIRLVDVPRGYVYQLYNIDDPFDAIETQIPDLDPFDNTTSIIFDELEGDVTYMVKISTNHGCETIFDVYVPEIISYPEVIASVSPNHACVDGLYDGAISVQANSEVEFANFMFSFNGGEFDNVSTWTSLSPGFYTVSALELNSGCLETIDVFVYTETECTPVIQTNARKFCLNELDATLTATATLPDGCEDGGFTYRWANECFSTQYNTPSIPIATDEVMCCMYSVTATSVATGCEATEMVEVCIYAPNTITYTVNHNPIMGNSYENDEDNPLWIGIVQNGWANAWWTMNHITLLPDDDPEYEFFVNVPDSIAAYATDPTKWNLNENVTFALNVVDTNGCPAHGLFNLVNRPVYVTQGETIFKDTCDYFIWHGTTYTASGTYTYSYTNADGYDNVDTLHLTIRYGSNSVETVTACDSYEWHGVTYYSSTTATYNTVNALGCDSIVTLYLTVFHSDTVEVDSVVCENELPLTWNGLTFNEAGTQTLLLSNVYGCDSVVMMNLTVNDNPVVTIAVANGYPTTVCEGGSTMLTANVAGGYGNVSYQWFKNYTVLVGETNQTLNLDSIAYNGTDIYAVVVTQSGVGCANYTSVTLNTLVTVVPSYTVAITGFGNVCEGGTLTLAATVDNVLYGDVLSYQWYRISNGIGSNGTGMPISGANSAQHQTSDLLLAGSYDYYVVVNSSISGCSVVSPIVPANVVADPSVSINGANTVCEDGNLTLNAFVTGGVEGAAYTYTWHWTGAATGSATTAAPTFVPTVSANDAAIPYYFTVTISRADNTGCDATSEAHEVNVLAVPAVTVTADNNYVCQNGDVTFTAHVSPVGAYNYVWTINGQQQAVNASTITTSIANVGTITASVEVSTATTSVSCSATATIATPVQVVAAPTVTISADHTTMCVGGMTTLTAIPNANNNISGSFNYEWIVDGTPVSGVTNVLDQTLNDAGIHTYQVKISQDNNSGCNSTWSAPITVHVAEQPVVTLSTEDSLSICEGGSVTMTGVVTNYGNTVNGVTNSSIYGALTFDWTTNGVSVESDIVSNNNFNQIVHVLNTVGNYSYQVIVTPDGYNCLPQASNIHVVEVVNDPYWTEVHVYGSNSAGACLGDTVTLAAVIQGGVVDDNGNTGGLIQWTVVDENGNTMNVCGGSGGFSYDIPNTVGTYTYIPTCSGYIGNGCQLTSTNGTFNTDSLMLTVNTSSYHTLADTVVENDLPYLCNGQEYFESGTYYQTLTNAAGCDSLLTVNLTVLNNVWVSFDMTVCDSYVWNGINYTQSGDYTQLFSTVYGTDSTVTMHLTINYSDTLDLYVTACDSYDWNNVTFTTSGDYTQTFTAANDCDSVVTLHLSVNYSNTGDTTTIACGSFDWYEHTNLTQSGEYTHTFTNAAGCDSVVTLHLTILHGTHNVLTEIVCDSYEWHGITYTQSGIFTYDYVNTDGCPSTDTLTLTVNSSSYHTLVDTVVENDLPYLCNGQAYLESGTYYQTLTNAAGCDSLLTVNLTILNNVWVSFDTTVCDSYVWNGINYTQSGDYTQLFSTVYGTDSTVTMHLTINYSDTLDLYVTACDSYDWNGVTYTESGNYSVNLSNATGCDSLVTLHLTINYSDTANFYATACNSYNWNGETYTESGDYTFIMTNATGCDLVTILHLTIYETETSELFVTTPDTCYTWNDITYCQTGDYIQTFQAATGCDSIVTLHLTITVGINNVDGFDFKVYPNPTNDYINVQCTMNNVQMEGIEVIDIYGKVVHNVVWTNNDSSVPTRINVSGLASGMYFVRVTTSEGAMTKRFLKK